MKKSPSSGGTTTQQTVATVEIRDNAYWPDEIQIANLVAQGACAENDASEEQDELLPEDSSEYAVLYFVS